MAFEKLDSPKEVIRVVVSMQFATFIGVLLQYLLGVGVSPGESALEVVGLRYLTVWLPVQVLYTLVGWVLYRRAKNIEDSKK